MYGKLGLPRLGAVGCGVSSAITMWLMLVFMAAYIKLSPVSVVWRVRSVRMAAMERDQHFGEAGTPIAVSLFMEASLFGVAALVIVHRHERGRGHQIALNVALSHGRFRWAYPWQLPFAWARRSDGRPMERDCGLCRNSVRCRFMSISALVMFTAPRLHREHLYAGSEVRKWG